MVTRGSGRESVLPAARFDVASFGEVLSDPSRVAILMALMDGSARPATELAAIAGVTRSTASSHLHRLVEGGLLSVEAVGRHRYFRLASEAVGDAIEAVALAAPSLPRRPEPRQAPERAALADARTCYRHLAGKLGVAVYAALENQQLVALEGGALGVTKKGETWLEALRLAATRWPMGKPCLDWTERRHHLGGPLGALLTDQLFAMVWIARCPNGRAVRVTARGAIELERQLGVRVPVR